MNIIKVILGAVLTALFPVWWLFLGGSSAVSLSTAMGILTFIGGAILSLLGINLLTSGVAEKEDNNLRR